MEITATAAGEEGEQWVKLSHLFGDYDAPIEIPTPEPGRPFPIV